MPNYFLRKVVIQTACYLLGTPFDMEMIEKMLELITYVFPGLNLSDYNHFIQQKKLNTLYIKRMPKDQLSIFYDGLIDYSEKLKIETISLLKKFIKTESILNDILLDEIILKSNGQNKKMKLSNCFHL